MKLTTKTTTLLKIMRSIDETAPHGHKDTYLEVVLCAAQASDVVTNHEANQFARMFRLGLRWDTDPRTSTNEPPKRL